MTRSDAHRPDTWAEAKLNELVWPTRLKHSPKDFPGLPFIGMENIESHTMKLLGTVPASSMKSSAVHFYPNDVLYGRLRPYLNKVYSPDFEGLCSAEFIVLPPNGALNPKYLQYFLNSSRFVSFASHLNAGDRPRVDFDQLGTFPTPVPPIKEQERIVEEVEKQFTRLDAAIAALKRVQANLKHYRAAVLKAACEGRLVPTEAELARREGVHKTGPASPILEGWRSVTLSELAEIQGGIQKQPTRRPVKNAFPFLRVANVLRGRLDLSEMHLVELFHGELEKLRLQEGDLLIVEGNGSPTQIGRMAVWKGDIANCVHQNHIIRARLKPGALPGYVEAFWNSPQGARCVAEVASSTSGLYTLSVGKVGRIQIPLPPPAEQARIVNEIERRLSSVEEIEREIEGDIVRGRRLQQSILKLAFEGKLAPQDQNDEPAGVLLERIRGTANPGCAPTRGTGNKRSRRDLTSKETVHV